MFVEMDAVLEQGLGFELAVGEILIPDLPLVAKLSPLLFGDGPEEIVVEEGTPLPALYCRFR